MDAGNKKGVAAISQVQFRLLIRNFLLYIEGDVEQTKRYCMYTTSGSGSLCSGSGSTSGSLPLLVLPVILQKKPRLLKRNFQEMLVGKLN